MWVLDIRWCVYVVTCAHACMCIQNISPSNQPTAGTRLTWIKLGNQIKCNRVSKKVKRRGVRARVACCNLILWFDAFRRTYRCFNYGIFISYSWAICALHRITLTIRHLMWLVSQINIKESFVYCHFNEPFSLYSIKKRKKEKHQLKAWMIGVLRVSYGVWWCGVGSGSFFFVHRVHVTWLW